MIRSFNWTGRKRIPHSRVAVSLAEGPGGVVRFDPRFDLAGMDLPTDALVYFEAYYRNSYMRFPFGRVGAIEVPARRDLTDLDTPLNALFRVKVVDGSSGRGRLLAEGTKIQPRRPEDRDGKRICLLHVDYQDLGDEIWKLDFETEWPVLLVNKRISGIRDILQHDQSFAPLVYPAVVREILVRVLLIREDGGDPEEEGGWQNLWLQFIRRLPPASVETIEEICEKKGPACDEWIDQAVAKYCAWAGSRETFASGRSAEEPA